MFLITHICLTSLLVGLDLGGFVHSPVVKKQVLVIIFLFSTTSFIFIANLVILEMYFSLAFIDFSSKLAIESFLLSGCLSFACVPYIDLSSFDERMQHDG